MALYRCRKCGAVKSRPRRFMFYFQDEAACPLCGTGKLKRLTTPDHIDPMRWSLYNLLRWFSNFELHHCRYCRIQFYDRQHGKKGGA